MKNTTQCNSSMVCMARKYIIPMGVLCGLTKYCYLLNKIEVLHEA